MTDLYQDIDLELPLGKDRIILDKEGNFDLKEALEKMAISPERKILIKCGPDSPQCHDGIITLSNIFNLLQLDN